jgi:hypothetical protein
MAPVVRKVSDRYRAEWQALGKAAAQIPFLGVTRLIVLAPTDAQAQRIAERSYVS